ncbi:MG2 domain-containing protein [Myroides albus]|uniref:Alpha-2-macroglobulin domain-containing protein n=1 Tax=Myroides albus TaxID=2562892 RepID=A0A6I3LGJ0_9FLAO|nr:alpha-2-macroglobulin family protein [Myroides albus]MTG97303.1 hypothetical protein [Myroides albus]UVD80610.1 MG2 domain-containing protein [Myroides albus]
MKNIGMYLMLFAPIITFGQGGSNNELSKLWKNVLDKERNYEVKEMRSEVEQIIDLSRKQKDQASLLKAMFYKAKIMITTEAEQDYNVNVIMDSFEDERKSASGIYAAVIDAYIAKLYVIYKSENLYTISNRTALADKNDNSDIRFATIEMLDLQINKYYKSAIALSKQYPFTLVEDWQLLFLYDKKSSIDLSYFSVYEAIRLDYANFLKFSYDYTLSEKDIEAKTLEGEKYEKEVISDLQKRNQKDLVLYVSLYQVQNNHRLTSVDKKALYEQLLKENATHVAVNKVYAQFLYDNFSQYSVTNDFKVEGQEVLAFADKALSTLKGKITVEEEKFFTSIKQNISNAKIAIRTSTYALENKHIPLFVEYKNTDKVYVHIYANENKNNSNEFEFDLHQKEGYSYLTTQSTRVDSYELSLKKYDDYKTHASHVALHALTAGKYFIVVSSSPFDKLIDGKDNVEYIPVNVTDKVIVFGKKSLRAYNRVTGEPLANARIKVANSRSDKDDKNYWETIIVTDSKGEHDLSLDKQTGNRNFSFEGDNIIYSNRYYKNDYLNEIEDKKYSLAKTFSDRAIYRPGQIVYFKSILTSLVGVKEKIEPNKQVEVILKDVDNNSVATLKLTSNEFGSIQGSFVLPNSGRLGRYSIEVQGANGVQYLSVEEYKRPKFEVKVDKVKKPYQINDKVTVTGEAIAFSGVKISNAKVVYRIDRSIEYTFMPWYKRMSIPYYPIEQIKQGETVTDQDGKFTVDFKAIPEKEEVDKDSTQTYLYTVNVDVVDETGETHSVSSIVRVGNKSVMLDFGLGNVLTPEDLARFTISTKTLNQEDYPTTGEVALYELKSLYPTRVLNKKHYQLSDEEVYSYSEFVKLFPYLPYGNELDKKKWKEGKAIFTRGFNTKESKEITWKESNTIKSGSYVLKGKVIGANGELIEVDQLVQVVNKLDTTSPLSDLIQVEETQGTYTNGGSAIFKLRAAINQTKVLVELYALGERRSSKLVVIDKGITNIELPIKKEYKGEAIVYFTAVKDNLYQTESISITVPQDRESISIEMGTFRDKLAPGQQESWSLTIKGEQKDKVFAEVLASMYDKSLDEFTFHSMNHSFVKRKEYYDNSNYYSFRKVFDNINYPTTILYTIDSYESYYIPELIKLNTFGFSYNYYSIAEGNNISSDAILASAPPSPVKGGAVMASAMAEPGIGRVRPKGAKGVGPSLEAGELYVVDGEVRTELPAANLIAEMNVLEGNEATALYGSRAANGVILVTTKEAALQELAQIESRSNLNETAFFYPQLKTDKDGNIVFEFKAPEALTQWKFMAFAHTKDLKSAYIEKIVQTQKELMVIPHTPRFLRQGDKLNISAKVANLSGKDLNGTVALMFFDAVTMQPIDETFANSENLKAFATKKGESAVVEWAISVPETTQAVVYRVVAKSGEYSDGEESVLPVLTNNILLTEVMPIYVKEGQDKHFNFDRLESGRTNTTQDYRLTFEMTTNPLWNAVFSLPSLRDNDVKNTDGIFRQLYANVISTGIINSNPKIKRVFDQWNKSGEITSRLSKNEELRSILLAETPWLVQAEKEEDRMKRIALLFDLNEMQLDRKDKFTKLAQLQNNDGGFPWFAGSDSNLFITQSIVEGFGTLKKMGMLSGDLGFDYKTMLSNAIQYIDGEQFKSYQRQMKNKKENYAPINAQYLYVRSFFIDDIKIKEEYTTMFNYYLKNAEDADVAEDVYTRGVHAIIANRYGKTSKANKLLKSIFSQAVETDEMGTYWKNNKSGYLWYQLPIVNQVLLLEAANEINPTKYEKEIENMKVWLLKNKQTNGWSSDHATAKAIYALMGIGKSWIDAEQGVSIKIGGEPLDIVKEEQLTNGYVKQAWSKGEINPLMKSVEVKKTSPGIAYGAMYWQYFENIDKITSSSTGVRFNKQLFIKVNTDKGEVLQEITAATPVKVGDKITVRLEIEIDRDMDYVHIKDMRASGFEPTTVLSGYRWGRELSYYEETRDASTNFFISRMQRGTYVFEYDLRASSKGSFSNGITTMQSMYAPEMSAHSEGINVEIK